jgi:hypothetical protein
MRTLLASLHARRFLTLCCVVAAWCSGISHAEDTPTPVEASIAVHPEKPGVKIPVDFIGLSCEKKILSRECFGPKSPTLLALCRTLGPGVLRIGGNEVETTFWSRTDAPVLESMQKNRYSLEPMTIGPESVDTLFEFARDSGWRVIYGLNLGTYNPTMAADEADYVLKVGGRQLLALEIGNEPNLYPKGPNRDGIRPGSYGYPQYKEEFIGTAKAIRAKNRKAPIAGPATTKFSDWMQRFMADFKKNITVSTTHTYPLSAAEADPKAPRFASVENLLGSKFPDDWLPKLESSNAVGVPYRVGECNTASGGGKSGVSDTFASALWCIDYMFDLAQHGAAGINIHGSFRPGKYSPIVFDNKQEIYQPAVIYYGMLFFCQAARGRLVPTECTTTANLVSYAAVDADGTLRVVLVNKDLTKPVVATVAFGSKPTQAEAIRLTAPEVTSTEGITLAGSAVAPDGTWTPQPGEVVPCTEGSCEVSVPIASAVLLTIN